MTQDKTTGRPGAAARIVSAAADLFAEGGYHAATMRDIADSASVLVGSIYNHFDDKEAVFQAALTHYNPIRVAVEAASSARGRDPDSILRDAGARMTGAFRDDPAIVPLLLSELLEFHGRHLPDLMTDALENKIAAFDNRIRSAGVLRDSIAGDDLFFALFHMVCIGCSIHDKFLEAGVGISASTLSANDFISIFLSGSAYFTRD